MTQQQQFADAVGVTREYISMIENGKRPITKRSLLISLAHAQGVSVTDLTGRPYAPESPQELLIYSIASGVRQALDEDYDDLPPLDPGILATTAHRVRVARMACDYTTLAQLLPDLVRQTRLLVASGGDTDAGGLALFVSATTDAAVAIKSHGHVDLAIRLADAAQAAALKLDEPAEKGFAAFAAFAVAQCALTGGARRTSLRLATEAAQALEDAADDRTLTWYGMLHLHAALSAAALGHVADVAPHLAEATTAARRITRDPWL